MGCGMHLLKGSKKGEGGRQILADDALVHAQPVQQTAGCNGRQAAMGEQRLQQAARCLPEGMGR